MEAGHLPGDCVGAEVAHPRGVDRRQQAHLTRVEVLFAVTHERGAVGEDDAGVDAALAHRKLPDRLTGLGLERMHGAVPSARDEQAGSADFGDDRRRIGRVERPAARRAHPDGLAAVLAERHESVTADRLVPPAGRQPADDHQVAVEHRRHGAPAMCRDEAEILVQRSLPPHVAVSRQRQQTSPDAEQVEMSGGRVADG